MLRPHLRCYVIFFSLLIEKEKKTQTAISRNQSIRYYRLVPTLSLLIIVGWSRNIHLTTNIRDICRTRAKALWRQ